MKQILRKEISREVKDGKETIINEHIEMELLNEGYLNEIYDQLYDDHEAADNNGIYFDEENKIHTLDLGKLLRWVKYELNNLGERKQITQDELDTYEYLEETIEPYKEYMMYIKEEEK